jgi:hypothetical protein
MTLQTVFNNGSSNGLIGSIPKGGHKLPNSTVGDNALVLIILSLLLSN